MLGSIFDGVEEFFGTQCYSLVWLVLFLFKLGRTFGIALFGFGFVNLRVKFSRTKRGLLYTFELYFNPIFLVLFVL